MLYTPVYNILKVTILSFLQRGHAPLLSQQWVQMDKGMKQNGASQNRKAQ